MRRCGTSGAIRVLTLASLLSFAIGCWGSAGEAPSAARPGRDAGAGFVPDTKPAPTARWEDALVPAGITIPLVLAGRLDSATSRPGDMFQARVARAVLVGDFVAIPSDSVVSGFVTAVTSGKEGGEGGGKVVIRFNSVSTPTGAGAGIQAHLSGIEAGGPGRQTPILAATPAAGPSGTTIAAGARGREAVLEAEAQISITLDQPMSIKVRR